MSRVGTPEKGEFRVLIKPDCYVGIEEELVVPIEVLPAEAVKESFLHPEDLEACKRKTLFMEMMSQMKQGEDSENELEEDDKDKAAAEPIKNDDPESEQSPEQAPETKEK